MIEILKFRSISSSKNPCDEKIPPPYFLVFSFLEYGFPHWYYQYPRCTLNNLQCVRKTSPDNSWAVGSASAMLRTSDNCLSWQTYYTGIEADLRRKSISSSEIQQVNWSSGTPSVTTATLK
ncbi:MAG: hypothetical protein NTX61_15665 [Bacteroidetes bacterium]|nr:hypothetical protein [Bacteroidota bacterium]